MDSKNIVGSRLNAALARRNVKQKELAQYLNVPDNTISYFCSGKRTPNVQQIAEIAKRLEISTDYLLGVSDVMSADTATRELCLTLGLNDIAIESLQEDSNSRIQNVINFLFLQHHYARNIRHAQKSDEFEKMFADRAENENSVLMLLSEFLSILRAEQDLSIILTPDGELTISKVGGDMKMNSEAADLRLQIDTLKGEFVFISLLQTASKDVTDRIARTLDLISTKRVTKFEFDRLKGETSDET